MERLRLRKEQYRLAAAAALGLALLLVLPMVKLFAGHLPFLIHLPLAALCLGLFSVSALAAGVAWVHYRTGPYRD